MKQNTGITLVALIITVIILLILAMVSVRLIMNSGIITRADKGTNQIIEEQIRLAYSDYKTSRFDFDTRTVEEFIEDELKNKFKNNSVKSVTKNEDKIIVTTETQDKVYVLNLTTQTVQEQTN